MSFLKSAMNVVTGFFTRSSHSQQSRRATKRSNQAVPLPRDGAFAGRQTGEEPTAKCERWLDSLTRPNKRKSTEDHEVDFRKRIKTTHQHGSVLSTKLAFHSTGTHDTGNLQTNTRTAQDRALMPPPATPLNRKTPTKHQNQSRRRSLSTMDTFSETQSHITRRSEAENEYDMEAARRHAAATQLPPNSGVWETAEKDLFFHLAYRGFEPLLPSTWMTDFRTLPLSLFATRSDQVPLIQNHKSTEFRAIKALSDLIETGKNVRDRALSPKRKLRKEPLIEKAAAKYIKWALEDIGVSRKEIIPVHTVVAMKKEQSTLETIRELTVKMHKLSARHREVSDVLASVEPHHHNDSTNGTETHLLHDPIASEQRLPIIYGLMVCSSLLAIFTLSSHTPPPRFIARKNNQSAEEDEDGDDENEDSGLRFIHSFDFSDSAADVWNAFVIAIVAMEIRKSIAEIYEIRLVDGREDREGWVEGSGIDGEVDGLRTRARTGRAESASSVLEEDDTDL